MILCRKCKFENHDGTKFCQNCGAELSYKKSLNLKGIAGMGMKGVSAAPLAARTVEGQANQLKNQSAKNKIHVKTLPLEDGSWYCPDCGEHNKASAYFCSGCGRDK